MKIVKNIQKLSHEIVVYAKDGRKSHLTLHWSAENVKIDKTNFSLRNTIPLHGMNKTNDERCYTAAVWTQISIPPLQVRGALSGGWVGWLCQWELKAPTDRSRSDCVHEQVAKRIANVRFTTRERKSIEYSIPFPNLSDRRTEDTSGQNIWLLSFSVQSDA